MSTIHKTRGFTLIELVIAVTIIIILGALAIPNYRNYVLRANRTDATAALLRVAAAQEKFYMQNNTYTTDLGATGLNVGSHSANNHYVITIQGGDADGFVAIAKPDPDPLSDSNQDQDTQCTEFRVDQDGARSASGTAADKCWR